MVNPDSNPTLSLSVYMFFGPALLWIGATLLLVRLRGRAHRAGSRGAPAAGRTTPRRLAARRAPGGAARRSTAGWSWSACCSPSASASAIFTATYDQQAKVDAQLTLGADVTVSRAARRRRAPARLPAKVAAVPGVAATTRVDHSYAYVGPDLQDTFGIDPATFRTRDHACATPTSSAAAPSR